LFSAQSVKNVGKIGIKLSRGCILEHWLCKNIEQVSTKWKLTNIIGFNIPKLEIYCPITKIIRLVCLYTRIIFS